MSENSTGPTDTELALKAQAGDSSAFEAIYERHADGVARTLASFAGPGHDDLSDLVQEVFVRVIDNLNSYRPTAPFENWLYTVALNVGRNHVRSAPKTMTADPTRLEILADRMIDRNDPDDYDMASAAFEIVATLPEGVREVVALRAGSGLPYAEIAGLLRIPEGTARRRMYDAITTIRERLGLNLAKKGG